MATVNLNAIFPELREGESYFLRNADGAFDKVEFKDLKFHGCFKEDMTFPITVVYDGCIYDISDVCRQVGTCVEPVPTITHLVCFQIIGSHGCMSFFSVFKEGDSGVWELNNHLYTCDGGELKEHRYLDTLKCNGESICGLNFFTNSAHEYDAFVARFDAYPDEEVARFWNKCPAVASESLSDLVVVTDSEMTVIETKLRDLKDWADARGISFYYDTEDRQLHFVRDKNLPKGYKVIIDDCHNDNIKSMMLPHSGYRGTNILNIADTNCDYRVVFDYNEPEREKE